MTISSPSAADTHSTGTPTLTLGGTATDNFTITQVTWTNSRGGGGTATGTTAWSASNIALQAGSNVLTVTARDSSGNLGTDTLTVNLSRQHGAHGEHCCSDHCRDVYDAERVGAARRHGHGFLRRDRSAVGQ